MQYHEIFVPGTEIFDLSGETIFYSVERQLEGEKNLIVIPFQVIKILGEHAESGYGIGADEALTFIRDLKSAHPHTGYTLYEISNGLDLAIIKDEFDADSFGQIISNLENIINKHWTNGRKPILLTNDSTLHIEFRETGYKVEMPNFLLVSSDIVNEGVITGSDDLLARLTEKKVLTLDEVAEHLQRDIYPNQFIKFFGQNRYVYAAVSGKVVKDKEGMNVIGYENPIVKLLPGSEYGMPLSIRNFKIDSLFGWKPGDMDQFIAIQYGLLNPDVRFMFLSGGHGTGKTLFSYLAAVQQILDYRDEDVRKKIGLDKNGVGGLYDQIVLLRPNDIVGGKKRDIGFIPGSEWDKMAPFLKPFRKAHERSDLGYFSFDQMVLHPYYATAYGPNRSISHIGDEGVRLPDTKPAIEMTNIGYLRGDTFTRAIIVVDEAQDLSPWEAKVIAARTGVGSKVIMIGDPDQKDNPTTNNNRHINGFTTMIQHYLGQPYVCLVNLTRNYRSEISQAASTLKVHST